jgi:putative peptidoglycan lipid II flippase
LEKSKWNPMRFWRGIAAPAPGGTSAEPVTSASENETAPSLPSDLGLTVRLSVITAIQIFISFIIQWLVVAELGVSGQADALYAGNTVPQVVTLLTIDTLVFVVVPLLAPRREPELSRNVWELFIAVVAMFSGLSLLFYLAMPHLMPLLVPGLDGSAKKLVVRLASVQVMGLVGAAANALLASVYQVRNRFIWPPVATLLCGVVGLALLAWKLQAYGVSLAAWVQLFMNMGPELLLLPVLGVPRKLKFDFKIVRQVVSQMRPLVFGSAYYKSGVLVDRWLASYLAPGSIVLLDLSQRTYTAATRVLNQGIVSPMVPQLAKFASDENWDGFRDLRRNKLKQMFMLSAIMVIGVVAIWLLREQLIRVLPLHAANVNPQNVQKMIQVFLLMSGVLLCSGLNHSLTMAYYAQGDTRTPPKIWSASFTIGLVAKVAGFFLAGLAGIALSVTLTNFITCGLLYYFWKPGLAGTAAEQRREVMPNFVLATAGGVLTTNVRAEGLVAPSPAMLSAELEDN